MQRSTLRLVTFFFLFVGTKSSFAAEKLTLKQAVNTIKASELGQHVDVLADDSFEGREAGSRGGNAAAKYLVQKLEKYGVKGAGNDGSFYQPFGAGYRNVLAMVPGADAKLKNDVILIGAHFDHVGYGNFTNSLGPTGYIHNGADDNASGTAGLLELAEAFAIMTPPRRTIVFAFWDGEEKGLLGSKHWAVNSTLSLDRIKFAINMDMIGRLRPKGLEVYGTRTALALRQLVCQQNTENTPLVFNWDMKNNSDHYTFFARNIPSMMFHSGLHDNYHRPSDDAHLVNKEGMESISKLAFRFTASLDKLDALPTFRRESRQESEYYRGQMERPSQKRRPRLGVQWSDFEPESKTLPIVLVTRGSAAQQAGLRPGDRIKSFNSVPISGGDDLRQRVLAAQSKSTITVLRNKKEETIDVQLLGNPVRLGIGWRVDPGEPGCAILTRVTPGTPARTAGLRVGDRIDRFGGKTFTTSEELLKLALETPFPIKVRRERMGVIGEVELVAPNELESRNPEAKTNQQAEEPKAPSGT